LRSSPSAPPCPSWRISSGWTQSSLFGGRTGSATIRYNLFGYNCEHVARWCATGRFESRQVDGALALNSVGGVGVAIFIDHPNSVIVSVIMLLLSVLFGWVSRSQMRGFQRHIEESFPDLSHGCLSIVQPCRTADPYLRSHDQGVARIRPAARISLPRFPATESDTTYYGRRAPKARKVKVILALCMTVDARTSAASSGGLQPKRLLQRSPIRSPLAPRSLATAASRCHTSETSPGAKRVA
jgi:hypothetical protein